MRFNVAGTTFRQEAIKDLKPEGEVTFSLDPENQYDQKAIKVMQGEHWFGYVPRGEIQEAIYNDLQANRTVNANVMTYSYFDEKEGWNDKHIGKLQSITIDVKLHTGYEKNDKQYDSITKLLEHYLFEKMDRLIEWACNCGTYAQYQTKLQEAADNGTKAHTEAEEILRKYQNGEELPESPVTTFLEKFKPKVLSTEEVLFDTIGVAGTYDALLDIDGQIVVIDWKTSKKVREKHKAQVAFYAKNTKASEGWVVLLGTNTKQGFSITRVKEEQITMYYDFVKLLKRAKDLLFNNN